MAPEDDEDARPYQVVVNHEDQYSIWPAGKPVPAGWRDVGATGSKAECLERIRELWTDMTPASLRGPRER
jgi:MbtH protein